MGATSRNGTVAIWLRLSVRSMSKCPARSGRGRGPSGRTGMVVECDRRLSGGISRGRKVELVVDGVVLPAFEGESVAAALLAAGRRGLRVTPRHGDRRGMYCGIGLCFECVMVVD